MVAMCEVVLQSSCSVFYAYKEYYFVCAAMNLCRRRKKTQHTRVNSLGSNAEYWSGYLIGATKIQQTICSSGPWSWVAGLPILNGFVPVQSQLGCLSGRFDTRILTFLLPKFLILSCISHCMSKNLHRMVQSRVHTSRHRTCASLIHK